MATCEEDGDSVINIGLLEKSFSWKLESRFFPSKVGGKPAWLDFQNLPSVEENKCKSCGKPCVFLCQIYAPVEEKETCFHRTIFIFMCRDAECCQENENSNFSVFRCQLRRKNLCYPFEAPVENEQWRPDVKADSNVKLCRVCGCKGKSHCGKCKNVNYCTRDHQIIDWKSGHKNECLKDLPTDEQNSSCRHRLLLPEFEIIIDEEDYDKEESEERSDESRLEEYENLVKENKAGTLHDDISVDKDLMSMAMKEDGYFQKFCNRIAQNPKQVIRYDRGGEPLWISHVHKLEEADVPDCQYCGGPRQLEFQILPQLLNSLQLDSVGKSIDWGILVVYTCRDSCDDGPTYKAEFLWKQDYIETKNKE